MDLEKKLSPENPAPGETDEATGVSEVLNASGHKQELERNFSLLSLCAIGITTGNVWAALGGSIVRESCPVACKISLVARMLICLRLLRFTMAALLVSSTNSSL
jgi:hypothetical protein